jgi:hypothetical protein
MAATHAEKEGRTKGVDLLLSVALLLVFLHHYWYSYDLFKGLPSFGSFNPNALLNLILIRLNERYDLFLADSLFDWLAGQD